MGDFRGHAIPGSAFIVWSLWTWFFHVFCGTDQHQRRKDHKEPGRQLMSASVRWSDPRMIEAAFKVLLPSIPMVLEVYLNSSGCYNCIQHAFMYAFFVLSGLTDMIAHRRLLPLPANFDKAVLTLAFLNEALLFYTHISSTAMWSESSQQALENQAHAFLLASILATTLTLHFPDNTLYVYCMMLQGVWFWFIGFARYTSYYSSFWAKFESDPGRLVKLLSMAFTANCMACLLILLAMFCCFARKLRARKEESIEYFPLQNHCQQHEESNDLA